MRRAFVVRSLKVVLAAGLAAGCAESSRSPFEPSLLSPDVAATAPEPTGEPTTEASSESQPEPEQAPENPPAPGPPAPEAPPAPAPSSPSHPSSQNEDDEDDKKNDEEDEEEGEEEDDPPAPANDDGSGGGSNNNPPPSDEEEGEAPPPAEEEEEPIAAPEVPTGVSSDFVVAAPRSKFKITWTAVPGATSYLVELGKSAGSQNLGVIEVSATSLSTDDLPWGRVYARVRAKNGGGTSAASAEVDEWFFDFRDYIEAVFVGTGPLAPSDGNHGCSATGWVRGFPKGTNVPVLVSTTVSSAKVNAIKDTINQVDSATHGGLDAHFVQTTDPDPLPGDNQASSTTHEDASSVGCGSDSGCTIHKFVSNSQPGRYKSSRAVQPGGQTPEAYAHDAVGHGVIGLCHVDGNRIGGAGLSLMSAGPGVYSGDIASKLTTYDMKAAQAVYGAGLKAGDRKSDLAAAGVIKP